MRTQDDAKLFVFLLRENNFDFDKASDICRGLTTPRKMLLSVLPDYLEEERQFQRGASDAAQTRKKWVEEQLKP